ILTRDMIENSRSGNPFEDRNRLIVRLDVIARNEDLQEKLAKSTEWDLIICDEAHRMSATYFFGGEVKYTKRYQIGQKLGELCRPIFQRHVNAYLLGCFVRERSGDALKMQIGAFLGCPANAIDARPPKHDRPVEAFMDWLRRPGTRGQHEANIAALT